MLRLALVGLLVAGCGDDSMILDAGARDSAPPRDVGIPDTFVPPDVSRVDAGPGGCSVRIVGESVEDTCSGEEICVCAEGLCEGTGTCSFAFGRRYRIGVAEILLADRRPDGMCWDDPGCGAPDPYVVTSIDGSPLLTTDAANDLYAGVYDPPAVAEGLVFAGSEVRVDIWDSDLVDDDYAHGCLFRSVTAAQLRARDLSCTGETGSSLLAFITPVP